jgi:hypothetical protein
MFYWLHVQKFCEKESPVESKAAKGCLPLISHQGNETKKKKKLPATPSVTLRF